MRVSKLYPRTKLQVPPNSSLLRHSAEVLIPGIGIGSGEVGTVGRVQRIHGKPDVHTLRDQESTLDPYIPSTKTVGSKRTQSSREYARVKRSWLSCGTPFKANEVCRQRTASPVSNARIEPRMNILLPRFTFPKDILDFVRVSVEKVVPPGCGRTAL